MKKIKALLLCLSVLSVIFFTACKSKNNQPYITQNQNAWSRNACGAFSMAYFLAETGQIPASKIEETAKKFYARIKFDPQAGMGEYSDPFKIAKEIAPYVQTVSFGMNISNPQTPGEKLMSIFTSGVDMSMFTDITDFSASLKKGDYVIEIVVPQAYIDTLAPLHNPLHYVLTYWKGDTLYTLDPGRGKEEPRQNFIDGTTAKWCFFNSGIFLTPISNER